MTLLRRLLTFIVWLLILVLLPISAVALYARGEIFDTNQFVSSVAPIASDPDVQTAISNRLITSLDTEAKLMVESGNPAQVRIGNEYLTNRDSIADGIATVLESSEFQSIWEGLNRAAHDALVSLLRGKDSSPSTLKDGEVEIDLAPIVSSVRNELDAKGIDTLDSIELKDEQLTLTIFQSDKLAEYHRYARWLDEGAVPLAIGVAALSVIFLILAVRKLRAIGMLIATILFGIGLIWAALAFGRDYTVEKIADPDARAAALAIYDSVLNPLHDSVRGISSSAIGVGAIALVLMFLRRPARR